MSQIAKLTVLAAVLVFPGLLLHAGLQPKAAEARNGGSSGTWVKMEFPADSGDGARRAAGFSGPLTRWVNLEQANGVSFYRRGDKDEVQVRAGGESFVSSDAKQRELIRRYLERNELK